VLFVVVNWENLWDQSMIKRARELGGAEFDWVLWDLARKNARAYRRREAIVDTFVGTAAGGHCCSGAGGARRS